MPISLSRSLLAAVTMLGALPALAQENERAEFAGGVLTITETEDMDRVLAFDGQELGETISFISTRSPMWPERRLPSSASGRAEMPALRVR